jgi:hypothetical protein
MTESESYLQSSCVIWLWNTRPETRNLLCYNLNNSRNKIDGAKNKALGLIPGRADLEFLWNGKAHFIEIKTETGTQQPNQKDWEKTIKQAGFTYTVIRSLAEFQTLINKILDEYTS